MQTADSVRVAAAHAPYLQPQRRPAPEKMSFNEQIFIIRDYSGQYVELQFEEVRLRDYRAPALDEKLFELEASAGFQRKNPLSASALAASQVQSPTITTRFAMEQLQGVLTGTPTLNMAPALPQVGPQDPVPRQGQLPQQPQQLPQQLPQQPLLQLDPEALVALTAKPYSGTMGPDGNSYCGVGRAAGLLRTTTDQLVARNQRRMPLMQRSGMAATAYGGSQLELSVPQPSFPPPSTTAPAVPPVAGAIAPRPVQIPLASERRGYNVTPIAGGNIHDFDTDLGLAELMGEPGG